MSADAQRQVFGANGTVNPAIRPAAFGQNWTLAAFCPSFSISAHLQIWQETMSLQEIGTIGELLGSAAVVITLVYVAVQLRQNTQAIRAAAVQSITETVATNVTNIAANAENASVFRRGLSQFHEMSETEQAQFALIMNSIFL